MGWLGCSGAPPVDSFVRLKSPKEPHGKFPMVTKARCLEPSFMSTEELPLPDADPILCLDQYALLIAVSGMLHWAACAGRTLKAASSPEERRSAAAA
jgi:hypothetical protein